MRSLPSGYELEVIHHTEAGNRHMDKSMWIAHVAHTYYLYVVGPKGRPHIFGHNNVFTHSMISMKPSIKKYIPCPKVCGHLNVTPTCNKHGVCPLLFWPCSETIHQLIPELLMVSDQFVSWWNRKLHILELQADRPTGVHRLLDTFAALSSASGP